ncbi:MAG: NADH-ubiquinone oxidoreductase-F iron-sulfur binding region domain-containing protein [Bacilli bacterium]|jgi:NADH-quinone oxidoreductase subunit F
MIEHKLITKNIGKIDPRSIGSYISYNGYKMLKRAFKIGKDKIIEQIEISRLRGRGGAGFPMALKLKAVAAQTAEPKYLICNADEGEPGNFKDSHLIENNPHQIIEGMVIVAYATGVAHGFVYLRGEYKEAYDILSLALDAARKKGFLGNNILKKDFNFDIEIRRGAGSYVCGEEFALIESIEGKAGRTRVKPPFPTTNGLFGKPTLINNVETLATVTTILEIGGKAFSLIGTESSTGTKLISLSGNVRHKGVYEVPFGVSLREVIKTFGGGPEKGHKIKMVQLSGACGPIIPEYLLDLTIDYERFEIFESKTGAGAIIVIDERFDMFELLLRIGAFFTHESCGKCTPCREGIYQMNKLLQKFARYQATESDLTLLEMLARTIHQTALCGLGQTAATATISTLHYFRSKYIDRIELSSTEEGRDHAAH